MSDSSKSSLTDPAVAAGKPSPFRLIGLVVVLVLVAGGGWFWYQGRDFESTDDAFVETDVVPIAPRVGGTVLSVAVVENQRVKVGAPLFEIDPRDYQLRVTQARAALAASEARVNVARNDVSLISASTHAGVDQAEAAVAAAQGNLAQAQAQVRAAEAQARLADSDVERYKALLAKDEISRQRLDQATTMAEAAHAQADAARKAVSSAEALVRQSGGKLEEAHTAPRQVAVKEAQVSSLGADIATARAQLAVAEQDLAYAQVTAPVDGRVTRKSVLPGQVVAGGQAVLALVSGKPWVVANFKETQLARMAPGQAVEVRVDAYPQRALLAHVESLQPGTGSRFSLLPPENATGNYVKVVQRVPVKIVFDETAEVLSHLAPGMSVEPRVHVAAAR